MLDRHILSLVFPTCCVGCNEEINPRRGLAGEKRYIELASGKTLGGSQSKGGIQPTESSKHDSNQTYGLHDLFTVFDQHWCLNCWRKISLTGPYSCTQCGATGYQKSPLQNGCALCHNLDLRFEKAVAIGNYRGLLQELVVRMKNQHDEQLAVQLGNVLAYKIRECDFLDDLNLTIPVPTHWWRRVRRGFSAAEILSERIAAVCDLPHSNQVLRSVRKTGKQGTLSTAGRFKNVRGAFEVRPKTSVNGLSILLIDDVMTSGATASELARVLLRAGATKVYVGAVSYTHLTLPTKA